MRRPGAERPRVSQLDGLRGDDELDNHHALTELDELGKPSGRERRHRHPVFDALGVRGARHLNDTG